MESNISNRDPNAMIRDPNLVNFRVFVSNLPENCTRDELESIFFRYGKVLGSLVQKHYGFVQFESEFIADKAAAALNGSTFKGKQIVVRNAGKSRKPNTNKQETVISPVLDNSINFHPPTHISSKQQDYNDCEIIAVNKAYTEYAEYIEDRMKRLGLKVDLLFPNEDVPIGKVLSNISSRGCLYAILVTGQNEEHRSITVNILYGQPAEHRNMPMEDAINLIATDFQRKLQEENKLKLPLTTAPFLPSTNSVEPISHDRHPEALQKLLNLLADNHPLTVLQYDRIIKYLTERREQQVKVELGDASDIAPPILLIAKPKIIEPDPEIELQKKILTILNKPSITQTKPDLVYSNIQSLQNDNSDLKVLLKDVRVQRALDSLMNTNLLTTVENHFKF